MAGGLFTGVYVGMIIACADSTVPPGWLVCDGSLQSTSTYADLFAVVQHTYGSDPGGGQFRLPNMNNRYPRGATNTAPPGSYDGAASHSHSFTPTLSVANSAVSGGEHNHTPGGGFSVDGGGAHSHVANFGATSAAGGVNSARQVAPTAGTAQHHTHPTPGGANTNASGNHNHTASGGNIVDGQGAHNHSATVQNNSITTANHANDPKHNIVQYLIKT